MMDTQRDRCAIRSGRQQQRTVVARPVGAPLNGSVVAGSAPESIKNEHISAVDATCVLVFDGSGVRRQECRRARRDCCARLRPRSRRFHPGRRLLQPTPRLRPAVHPGRCCRCRRPHLSHRTLGIAPTRSGGTCNRRPHRLPVAHLARVCTVHDLRARAANADALLRGHPELERPGDDPGLVLHPWTRRGPGVAARRDTDERAPSPYGEISTREGWVPEPSGTRTCLRGGIARPPVGALARGNSPTWSPSAGEVRWAYLPCEILARGTGPAPCEPAQATQRPAQSAAYRASCSGAASAMAASIASGSVGRPSRHPRHGSLAGVVFASVIAA